MTDVLPEQAVDLDPVSVDEVCASTAKGLDVIDEQLIDRLAGRVRADGLQLGR